MAMGNGGSGRIGERGGDLFECEGRGKLTPDERPMSMQYSIKESSVVLRLRALRPDKGAPAPDRYGWKLLLTHGIQLVITLRTM